MSAPTRLFMVPAWVPLLLASLATGTASRVALGGARVNGSGLPAFLGQQAVGVWAMAACWALLCVMAFRGVWGNARQRSRMVGGAAALTAALAAAVVSPTLTTHWAHVVFPVVALAWSIPLAGVLGQVAWPTGLKLERWAWVAGGVAAGWFFTVSYLRHAWFGSGSKDMGLFLQSVWLLSRFHSPENTVMGMNAFADHMEFVDVLLAPLMWLWPDAGALLLVQAVAAGLGAVPVYRMARERLSPEAAPLCALAYFLAHDIGSGVQFDWNPTTVSLGLFPWALEAALASKWRKMAVFLVVAGLCKENLLLYVAGVGAMLWTLKAPPKVILATVLLPAVAFVVELKGIFPMFRDGGFRHFYYSELGSSFGDVILNILASPGRALTLLFNPGQKVQGLLLPFTSTGFLGLLAPASLLPMLPGMAERYWSTFQNSWWGHHYGGPTHALAVCGAILGGVRLKACVTSWMPRWKDAGAVGALLPALMMLGGTVMVDTVGPWGPVDLFQVNKPYHPSVEDRATMQAAVESIPDGVPVAAQNYLLAHVAARSKVFMLEHARDADFVAMTPTTNPWPYDRQFHDRLAQDLLNEGWRIHFCQGNSVVLARGAGQSQPCPFLGR